MKNAQRAILSIKKLVHWILKKIPGKENLFAITSIILLIASFVIIKYTKDFSFEPPTKKSSTKTISADFKITPFLDKPIIKTTETWKRFRSEVQSSNQNATIVFKNIDFREKDTSDALFRIDSTTNRIKFDNCSFDRDIDLAGAKLGSITFDA